jgi:hypothetical protein
VVYFDTSTLSIRLLEMISVSNPTFLYNDLPFRYAAVCTNFVHPCFFSLFLFELMCLVLVACKCGQGEGIILHIDVIYLGKNTLYSLKCIYGFVF